MAQEENSVETEATPLTDATDASAENLDDTTVDASAAESTSDADGAVDSDSTSDAQPDAQPELNASLTQAAGASDEASVQAERVEVENGRDYELMFIVRITESTDAATERVRAIIEASGGAVDNVRVSEQRRLAYPIKKEIEGFYIVLNGRYTKEAAAELDRALKLDEAVLRHMTVRLDEE